MATAFLRSLLAVARRVCDESTLANIVEPLLADLAYELSSTRNLFHRAIVVAHWSVGIGEAALLCGGRSLIVRCSQLSFEHLTVWFYGLVILAVVGAGPSWVRTGRLSLFATLQGLSRLVPYLPWTFGWGLEPPLSTVRLTFPRLVLLAGLVVVACQLNPGYGWSIAGMTVANFSVMLAARRWFPRSRPGDHLTIRS
jgi:hypothetical protein